MNKELEKYRTTISENYHNAKAGKSNCIEFVFPQLQQFYPGHERGMLLGITGSAKSGKTALASHLFYYATMDYLYANPNAFQCHFLWFPLEEPYKKFFARLDSYLLNKYYKKHVRYKDLLSMTKNNHMPDDVYNIWVSKEYRTLVDFYTERVSIVKYKKTAKSILNEIHRFAGQLGDLKKAPNVNGSEFDCSQIISYESNHPNGYFFVIIDNLSDLQPTKEEGIKYKAIEHLLTEIVQLKDLYNFCFVLLIQQNIKETGSLKAYLNDNILSTSAGIRDYPSLEADCTDLWCLSNPCNFPQLREYPQPGGYDLDAFKRSYFRVLQIVASRNGESSPPIPLFFDGAISTFTMLPPPDDYQQLQKVYDKINSITTKK